MWWSKPCKFGAKLQDIEWHGCVGIWAGKCNQYTDIYNNESVRKNLHKGTHSHLVLRRIQKGKYVSRSMIHDATKKMNEMLATISRWLYFDIFPISKNTSLASWRAKTTEPTRANLQEEADAQMFGYASKHEWHLSDSIASQWVFQYNKLMRCIHLTYYYLYIWFLLELNLY